VESSSLPSLFWPQKNPGIWGILEYEGTLAEISERRHASIERAHLAAAEAAQRRREEQKKYAKEMSTRTFDIASRKRQEVQRIQHEQLQRERDDISRWQTGLDGPDLGDESDYETDGDGNGDKDEDGNKENGTKTVNNTIKGTSSEFDHPDYYGRGYRNQGGKDGDGEENRGGGGRGGGDDDTESLALEERIRRAEKFAEEELARDAKEADLRREGKTIVSDSSSDDDGGGGGGGDHHQVGVGRNMSRRTKSKRDRPVKILPPPRQTCQRESVKLNFTKTEAPHLPMRENREQEIKEYRRKQVGQGGRDDATDMSERQPMFLKDKGDALMKKANLQGALAAYTSALELDNQCVPVLANRSLCLLKIGLPEACVQDCERYLALTRPQWENVAALRPVGGGGVPIEGANPPGSPQEREKEEDEGTKLRRTRIKILCRQAQALTQLQRSDEAVEKLEEAKALAETARVKVTAQTKASVVAEGTTTVTSVDGDLYEDILRSLEELQLSQGPMDVAKVLARGEERLKRRDGEGAYAAFSLLLGLPTATTGSAFCPDSVTITLEERGEALGGRAASCLLLERFSQCVGDASTALFSLARYALHVRAGDDASLSMDQKEVSSSPSGELLPTEIKRGLEPSGDENQVLETLTTCGLRQGRGESLSQDGSHPSLLTLLGKILTRRAMGLAYLKQYGEAVADFLASAQVKEWNGDDAGAAAARRDADNTRAMATSP